MRSVFRVNVALFPDSIKARDSLAEAYVCSENRAEAIAAYRALLAAADRDKRASEDMKNDLKKKAVARLKELGSR